MDYFERMPHKNVYKELRSLSVGKIVKNNTQTNKCD